MIVASPRIEGYSYSPGGPQRTLTRRRRTHTIRQKVPLQKRRGTFVTVGRVCSRWRASKGPPPPAGASLPAALLCPTANVCSGACLSHPPASPPDLVGAR